MPSIYYDLYLESLHAEVKSLLIRQMEQGTHAAESSMWYEHR